MISWTGLTKRRPSGQTEEEEEEGWEGVMPMAVIMSLQQQRVGNLWLATVAHSACYKAPGGTQTPTTIGDRGDPKLDVFFLTAGFVSSAGTSFLATNFWRVCRVQARFSKKYEARPRCVGIRGRCVYLWTAPVAVRGRKSAAAHWRDAICSFCCSASSRAERPRTTVPSAAGTPASASLWGKTKRALSTKYFLSEW